MTEINVADVIAWSDAYDGPRFDAVFCDPPYGLGFMGKAWDKTGDEFHHRWSLAVFRILKPGAYLLAFGGTRTHHRLMCALEDAGFEIRDCMMWLYGSGFPKSLNVGKALDKKAGVGREVVGPSTTHSRGKNTAFPKRPCETTVEESGRTVQQNTPMITAPTTDAAKQWDGYGTALKPAWEIVICARKPLNGSGERDKIVESLFHLEAQLWSLLPANIATEDLKLSQVEYDAACAFAQWSVEQRCNTRDALFGQMDMLQSVSAISMCLSTVQSWRSILAENLEQTSTCIIDEKESRADQTIDLAIWKSCISALTVNTIIRAELQAPGSQLSALPAARFLNAVVRSKNVTRELFALANAISNEQEKCQEEIGLGLRPNWEPIIIARKPVEGTVAANALKHGTGALNIDGGRIGTEARTYKGSGAQPNKLNAHEKGDTGIGYMDGGGRDLEFTATGRFPANVLLDEESAKLLDEQSGSLTSGRLKAGTVMPPEEKDIFGARKPYVKDREYGGDTGGASRFFYTAKAARSEREAGLPGIISCIKCGRTDTTTHPTPTGEQPCFRNDHPTLKPLDLCRYLATLILPPRGDEPRRLLIPFAGSGSEMVGAMLAGWDDIIGVEQDAHYVEIAKARLAHWQVHQLEFAL